MTTADSPCDSSLPVLAMGPLPPPIDGMTLLTKEVVQRLSQRTSVTVVDWSVKAIRWRAVTRAKRVARAGLCLIKLLLRGRQRDGRLYLTCNSKGGLLLTGLLVKAGRRMGYTIFLHHHVYAYIDRYDWRMAWVDRNLSAADVHLMHSPQMISDFRARYASNAGFMYVYPSIASLPLGETRQKFAKPFRIGHLSNLTIEKGLDLVLNTFRGLRERQRNVELILAGPFGSREASNLVALALKEFPESIHHLGAVYGQAKIDYYNSIDCFLFPTRYDCEAWPIALNEALDAGLPVIATSRGSIRTLVGEHAGPILDEACYVAEAMRQIEAWIDTPTTYVDSSRAATEQAGFLREQSSLQFENVVEQICFQNK